MESISIQKEVQEPQYKLNFPPLLASPSGNKYHPSDSKLGLRKEVRAGRGWNGECSGHSEYHYTKKWKRKLKYTGLFAFMSLKAKCLFFSTNLYQLQTLFLQ